VFSYFSERDDRSNGFKNETGIDNHFAHHLFVNAITFHLEESFVGESNPTGQHQPFNPGQSVVLGHLITLRFTELDMFLIIVCPSPQLGPDLVDQSVQILDH
jgi:hypothetical protein